MNLLWDCWMFMNRFRNCDLDFYFDQDLHRWFGDVNPRRFDTRHLLKPKSHFNIAFLIPDLSDTGGASLAHRYVLEDPPADAAWSQYILVTNMSNSPEIAESRGYRWVRDNVRHAELDIVAPDTSWVAKGKFIERWLHERQIDFAVAGPDPAVFYALASQPVLLSGLICQDSHTFTVGPGAFDYTFLVTRDQLFKYHLDRVAPAHEGVILLLPLHSQEYIDEAEPLSRADLGVPPDATVSATTNIWKSTFGDGDVLLRGIAELIRKNPRHHHVFVGTPRAIETLDHFVALHPDVRANIHYVGVVHNIYRLLKSIDFYVNSFPVSGGSDVEAAAVGVPSIELIANRDLSLHEPEFLHVNECIATSLDDFVRLGQRLITDADYRQDLGLYLKARVKRELDKRRILTDRLYGTFLRGFDRLLTPGEPGALGLDETVRYEKLQALYSTGHAAWDNDTRRSLLDHCVSVYPERPFGWIKLYEQAIYEADETLFDELNRRLADTDVGRDARVLVMQVLCCLTFGKREEAVRSAQLAQDATAFSPMLRRILADLVKEGQAVDRRPEGDGVDASVSWIRQRLPLFYDY